MRNDLVFKRAIHAGLAIAVSVASLLSSSRGDAAEPADTIQIAQLKVHPPVFTITGAREQLQVVVTGILSDQSLVDLTRKATYEVEPADLASVNDQGLLKPMREGEGSVRVTHGDVSTIIAIEAENILQPQRVSFDYHTLPVLAQTGCSGGSCHGAPHGKAGFRLSLFGSDRELDRVSLTHQMAGRRINPIEPTKSLLLMKPTGGVAHQGGQRFERDDLQYELLRDWIAEGANTDSGGPRCVGIKVYPEAGRLLKFPNHTQQLSVIASFDDGSRRDVTHLTKYEVSNPLVAEVNRRGLVRGLDRGESAVIVRFANFIEAPLLTFVRDIEGFTWDEPEEANYIDHHVYAKLRQLQFKPSPLANESTFVRRVFLDTIGLLPTEEELEQYLSDPSPTRRQELIDQLLERPEYAKFWAQKWGDLLRVSTKLIGVPSVHKFNRWLEASVASNQPYDQFAEQILLATGSTRQHPQGNFFRSAADTNDATETAAQVFLGTRIQCAKCHNHPFERWTQGNYYGLSAFFSRLQRSKTNQKDEVLLWSKEEGEVVHPATGQTAKPWVPVAGEIQTQQSDRRFAFADWLTAEQNPLFAKIEVNRIWAQLMGQGIVEPFDDFRDSNPPANSELLEALAEDFVASGYDRRHIIRTVLLSHTYQASSDTNRWNEDDRSYFSHYRPRMMTAEQLVDALGYVTNKPETFFGVPVSTKATWVPAPDLKPHDRAKIGSVEFLKVFGQPERQSACECERSRDVSLGQALELLNGETVNEMITAKTNLVHQGLEAGVDSLELVKRLYRRALSREATEEELKVHADYIQSHQDKGQALEDTCWALLNRNEFLFQH